MNTVFGHVRRAVFSRLGGGRSALLPPRRSAGGLHEPDYLESSRPTVPLYNALNIQLRGYDYPVLESCQKFVHRLLRSMDVNVEECWAAPAQRLHVTRYKARSSVVDAQYSLQVYERTVQACDVTATQLPVVLRLLEASLPEGVTMSVQPHTDWDEEARYVPDRELLQLKTQLEDLSAVRKK